MSTGKELSNARLAMTNVHGSKQGGAKQNGAKQGGAEQGGADILALLRIIGNWTAYQIRSSKTLDFCRLAVLLIATSGIACARIPA